MQLAAVRVLIVDDEPLIVQTLALLLRRLGYNASGETSSVRALERVRSAPDAVDVLLTDQMMPEMTGDVLAQQVRAIRPDLPIVIMTGYSAIASPERADELGISAVLHKPLGAPELRAAIANAIQGDRGGVP
jgi:CheY-like chemotaxis protein